VGLAKKRCSFRMLGTHRCGAVSSTSGEGASKRSCVFVLFKTGKG